MNKLSRLFLAPVLVLAFLGYGQSSLGQTAKKPNIVILATGGTIAGTGASAVGSAYDAGKVAIRDLIEAVPQINEIAEVTGEQVVKIGSQDMTDAILLTLSKRINELLAQPQVDGIVVTHGTDTMEETAFFLSLTVNSNKPVVLVGAMRPSTSLSADGPLNLYNAVVVAASPLSVGKGVVVAMNGDIYTPIDVYKSNTTAMETFAAANGGPVGEIHNGRAIWFGNLRKQPLYFDTKNTAALPKVGIVYVHASVGAEGIEAMARSGYKGIVVAGVGNGNIHKDLMPALVAARKAGIVVVRSSRVPTGSVRSDGEINDREYQFVAAEQLNPQKARILLQLALLQTDNWEKIQSLFSEEE